MTARTKYLAAALLAAVGLAMTVGSAVLAPAAAQRLPDTPPTPPPAAGPAPRGGGGTGFGGFATAGPRGWEYKVTQGTLNRGDAEGELNKLGADGWELCATGERGALVFKRPRGAASTSGGRSTGFGRPEAGDAADPLTGDGNPGVGQGGMGGGGRRGSGTGGFNPAGPGPAGPVAGPGGRGSDVAILPLKNANAIDLAQLLKEVYGRTAGVAVTADLRTNSLVVSADGQTQKAIQALVERLDGPAADATTRKR